MLEGTSTDAFFGALGLALSSDGLTLAAGSPYKSSSDAAGSVHAYQWDSASSLWAQVGSTISGHVAGGRFGFAVSLSDNGGVLAVGAPETYKGYARVYELSSASGWSQRGADIVGSAEGDKLGASLSLSSDGSRVAVSTPRANCP